MKTAEEILKDNGITSNHISFYSLVIKSMKDYAEQVVDRCAELRQPFISHEGFQNNVVDAVKVDSILKIKEELT